MVKLTLVINGGSAEMIRSAHFADAVLAAEGRIRDGENAGFIKDVNGNTCGYFRFTNEEGESTNVR